MALLPSFELGKVHIPSEREAPFLKTKKKAPSFQKCSQRHLVSTRLAYTHKFHMVGIYFLRFSTTGVATCNISRCLLGNNKRNREFNGMAGKHTLHTVLKRSKRNHCKTLSMVLGHGECERMIIHLQNSALILNPYLMPLHSS